MTSSRKESTFRRPSRATLPATCATSLPADSAYLVRVRVGVRLRLRLRLRVEVRVRVRRASVGSGR